MPEKGNASWEGQEKTGPWMEDEILALPDVGWKEAALGFARYLRENQMAPQQWFGPNYWRVPHGEHYLCCILLDREKWRAFFFSGDYGGEYGQGFVKAVQDSVRPCVSCVDDCSKGREIAVFGKVFDACFQFPVQFENPDDRTLEYIKQLLEHWKEAAPRSDSWHCH